MSVEPSCRKFRENNASSEITHSELFTKCRPGITLKRFGSRTNTNSRPSISQLRCTRILSPGWESEGEALASAIAATGSPYDFDLRGDSYAFMLYNA